MILSACSPFFRNILRRNPHQHPLLYLKGVKYTDLQSVLNFMYHREVNIAQEELNSFLAVAEDLKVKGLTQNETKYPRPRINPQKQQTTQPTKQPPVAPLPSLKHSIPTPSEKIPLISTTFSSMSQGLDDDIQEVIPVKTEPRDPQHHQATAPTAIQPSDDMSSTPNHHSLTPVEDDSYGYQDEQYVEYEQYEDGQEYVPGVAEGGQQPHYVGTQASGKGNYFVELEIRPLRGPFLVARFARTFSVSKSGNERTNTRRNIHVGFLV
jgi:hypothetical protein